MVRRRSRLVQVHDWPKNRHLFGLDLSKIRIDIYGDIFETRIFEEFRCFTVYEKGRFGKVCEQLVHRNWLVGLFREIWASEIGFEKMFLKKP
ncbi:hypothetical protein ACFL5Z_15100 [Planctomycetota bacterium]